MVEIIGQAAALEMLAEECSELAQAALKLSRVVRGENPASVTEDRAQADVMEEWADVLVCSEYLDEMEWFNPLIVNQCIKAKKHRAKERLTHGKA